MIHTTKRQQNGFTLIELLVVVAIIGLLASIIIVSLSTSRAKGKTAAIRAEMQQMANGLELGYSASSYPDINPGGGGTGAKSVLINASGPNYASLSTIVSMLSANAGGALGGSLFKLCTNPNPPQIAYAIYVDDPSSSNVYCRDSNGGNTTYIGMPASESGGNCPPYSCQ